MREPLTQTLEHRASDLLASSREVGFSLSGPSGTIAFAQHAPLVLIAGMNVLEDETTTTQVAAQLKRSCAALEIPLVFKASFDKANRSSHSSPTGPGLERGLTQLATIRDTLQLPILTDVHAPEQVPAVAEVADIVQIPAFLCRQRDLIRAAAESGRPLHIKKMQLMAPEEMGRVLARCRAYGAERVILCERGVSFGYHRLVVDPLAFPILTSLGAPVSFDVTHALQLPGLGEASGGRGIYTEPLARAAVATGISALFLECHPEPSRALCDGPSALPLAEVEPLLRRLKMIDHLVKSPRFMANEDEHARIS
ncbi:MAG: 3-deoxy-8-phosphooctulonate synthase [Myxococcota bacterium]|nr:3-deoxy-8-phosphooctulonate synthase [Myxococcota bacterium]